MIVYGHSIKFGNKWFDIPGDGIRFVTDGIEITVVKGETTLEEMLRLITPVPDPLVIYDEKHMEAIGSYSGYTKLSVVAIQYDRHIYRTDEYADCFNLTFCNPELETRVEADEAQTFYTAMMTDTLLEEEA